MKNKYPIYVISKGRAEKCLTANFLLRDGAVFHIVIEPQEFDAYAAVYGENLLYVLPFKNLGLGSIPARNWVWEHSKKEGYERHWILDDNIYNIKRFYGNRKINCRGWTAFKVLESFINRYENIAVAGLNYEMFVLRNSKVPPFNLNCHVYSCLCIKNDLPYRWRGRYNEDTDLCLQVLSGGYCTVLFNAFLIKKVMTMTMKGGNATELYKGDGRLKMARSLERLWPYVVETKRRFKRPQHVIKYSWRKFDTELIKKPGLVIDKTPNEYGMKLKAVKEVKSEALKSFLKDNL